MNCSPTAVLWSVPEPRDVNTLKHLKSLELALILQSLFYVKHIVLE